MNENTVYIGFSSKAQSALRYRGIDEHQFVKLYALNLAALPFSEESEIDVMRMTVNKTALAIVRNLPERRMLVMIEKEIAGKTIEQLKTAMRRRRNYDFELLA